MTGRMITAEDIFGKEAELWSNVVANDDRWSLWASKETLISALQNNPMVLSRTGPLRWAKESGWARAVSAWWPWYCAAEAVRAGVHPIAAALTRYD